MPEMQVKLKLEATSIDPERFAPILYDMLNEQDEFAPRTIVVESDHSIYVEFGTGPASPGHKASNVNVHKEIEKWVERKLGIADPKKRRNVAHRIYKNIMENGMAPQPYARPAINKVMGTLSDTFFEDGGSIRELCDLIVREMQNQLIKNDTVYTGELKDNIRVYEGDVEESDLQARIPADVWNRDDVGYDGKRKAARYGS